MVPDRLAAAPSRTEVWPVVRNPGQRVRHGGFFWLAVTFGENSGWVRNVMAAREADLRYRGVDYHLVGAVMADVAGFKSEVPAVIRFGMVPLLGVHKVIRLRAIA